MVYTKVRFSWYLDRLPIPIKVPTMDGFRIEYVEDYPRYNYEEFTLKGNIEEDNINLYIKDKFSYYNNIKILLIEHYYYDNDGKKII